MRRIFWFAWALLLIGFYCIGQSSAYWQSRDSNYNISVSAAASYQGPGDIVSGAAAFYSCGRAYNAAFAATQGAICLIYGATTTTTCTLSVGTNGFANLTATPCVGGTVSIVTFCTVTNTTCYVETAYDQTGNTHDQSNATQTSAPVFTLSALNSLPCLTTSGANVYTGLSSLTVTAPFSVLAVSERTGNTGANTRIFQDSSGTPNFGYRNSVNTVGITAGTLLTTTASDNAFHALIGCYSSGTSCDGTTGAIAADGTIATGATGTGGSTNLSLLNGTSITGLTCEAAAYNQGLTSTQFANLNSNMHSASNGWNF